MTVVDDHMEEQITRFYDGLVRRGAAAIIRTKLSFVMYY